MTTEDEEKAEVLNAFFMSVFKGQTSYPQGTPLSDLVAHLGSRLNPPQFRRKQSETYYFNWTATSPWGQMGFL